jgi:hypothetical protein
MARLMFPGTGKLRFVPTLGSKTTPTAAQINAGVDLTRWLRQDGLNRAVTGNTTDVADATDTFDKTELGTYSANVEITFLRDSEAVNDVAFNTLQRGTRGYIVVAGGGWTGGGTTAVAGDRCEVWDVVVSSTGAEAEGPNKAQVFKVNFATPDAPVVNAIVA